MDRKQNPITENIIGAAIEVHRWLGSGLRERSYERVLQIEFEERGLNFEHQLRVPMTYKNRGIGSYRLDFLVERRVVAEVKSVERLDPVFDAQILAYLRATTMKIGLLINFDSRLLKDGVRRFVL
jgi:GxxExxY protein